jgi:uncharacterized protein YoxC
VETLVSISQIIFFLSISVLCIFLINYVGKITTSIANLEKSINELKDELDLFLGKVAILSDKSEKILNDISAKSLLLQNTFVNIRQISSDLLEFEKTIKSSIEKPLSMVINAVMGIITGLQIFNKNKND